MSTVIGCLIILYYIYILTDIDDFILDLQTDGINRFNSIGLFVTFLWLIYEFFGKSGPIALIPFAFGLLIKPYRKTLFWTRIIHIIVFVIIILTVSFIIINDNYLYFNFWKFTF